MMNPSQSTATLQSIRRDVFRALDEYSSDGVPHSPSEGGTADINERFLAALNRSVRRIFLAAVREKHIRRLRFTAPKILAAVARLPIDRSTGTTVALPADCAALYADLCGEGTLSFLSAEEEILGVLPLSSHYGNETAFRAFIPDGTSTLRFTTDTSLALSSLCLLSPEGLPPKSDENTGLLPDGHRLYAAFSKNCAELCEAFCNGDPVLCSVFTLDDGILSVDERLAGVYEVGYVAYPLPFTVDSPPDTPLTFPPAAVDAVIYATAAELCDSEDAESYARLCYRMRETLENRFPGERMRALSRNRFFSRQEGKGRRQALPAFRG